MALFTEAVVRDRTQRATEPLYKSASRLLAERAVLQNSKDGYDIFLSHAYLDHELVLGVALMIEDLGYSVYLDWRDDPGLDRAEVTSKTAAQLRIRMNASRCLFFATTGHSSESKWMPWELGFKDGHNGRVAILPIVKSATTSYLGQEYLGIYPYVDVAQNTGGKRRLWVRRTPTCYMNLDSWLKGSEPTERG